MIRAFQWDLARQVEKLDWLLAQLPKYADWGYQELHLHLEDAVDYPSLPGVARADAYSWRQFTRLVSTANRHGIKVVPIANLLGHTQYLIKTETWRDLNELRADDGSPLPRGQICPSHPRTLEVAAKLIHDLAPLCTAGKLHVGLDESFHLGKHPVSQREIGKIGLAEYFANYVVKLHDLVAAKGLRTAIWADMLVLLPAAINLLPKGLIAYDWYYHAFGKHPRFELYNFKPYNLESALRARGIEYWGCPMNGAFRYEPLPLFGDRLGNAISWFRRCESVQAAGFLVSSWEPSHLAIEMTTVVDAAIASLWLDHDGHDHPTMLKRGFARIGARNPASQSRIALACDDHPFSGYARWESHRHWDAGLISHEKNNHAAAARFFARSLRSPLTPAFAASIGWRSYLARRDHFIRLIPREILKIRHLVHRGKHSLSGQRLSKLSQLTRDFELAMKAASESCRDMWLRTRKASQTNPNALILRQDRRRLKSWKSWLNRAVADSAQLHQPSPVLGAWQLSLVVHNIQPAAQLLVVQQCESDGAWRDIRSRHAIEFRTIAARRRSAIKRDWSLPIVDPELPLRLAIRGTGLLSVSHIKLTNGIEQRLNCSWPIRQRKQIGHAAPESDWVNLDWNADQDLLPLRFESPRPS